LQQRPLTMLVPNSNLNLGSLSPDIRALSRESTYPGCCEFLASGWFREPDHLQDQEANNGRGGGRTLGVVSGSESDRSGASRAIDWGVFIESSVWVLGGSQAEMEAKIGLPLFRGFRRLRVPERDPVEG
jgi:hypothetical protein